MPPYQKHVPSEQVRSSGKTVHEMVVDITKGLITGAKEGIKADYLKDLYGWGAQIEMFDAFISIYYEEDKVYLKERERLQTEIAQINPNNTLLRMKVFRLYKEWFRLIAKKLARFKIFPPLPVSYAQGLGEIREVE
ncbi:hypothetical protein LCGC14_1556120 [marine sediment metagenome]|uniref:Uncharacterized protein n=1 Tax=marine sediment metagenome TaxID=412755 RepID=A0A0F9INV6_9ZZZZ